MGNIISKKTFLFFIIVIGTTAIAYILGGYASDYSREWKKKRAKEKNNASILGKMGNTIGVGGLLPDGEFQDLDGHPVKLSKVVCTRSVVAFSLPGCGYTLQELKSLHKSVDISENERCFVLVSDEDPTELMYIQEKYKLFCQILYDKDRHYQKSLGIFTSPFNIVVDKTLKIQDIQPGNMSGEEIKESLKNK